MLKSESQAPHPQEALTLAFQVKFHDVHDTGTRVKPGSPSPPGSCRRLPEANFASALERILGTCYPTISLLPSTLTQQVKRAKGLSCVLNSGSSTKKDQQKQANQVSVPLRSLSGLLGKRLRSGEDHVQTGCPIQALSTSVQKAIRRGLMGGRGELCQGALDLS